MEARELPTYAVFDDYRYSQRIAVVVRWFVLATWLSVNNYRNEFGTTLLILNAMGIGLAILNSYVHWRIWRGRPITKRYVIALSVMDLSIITAGLGMTNRFGNTFFPLYYPALLPLALIFSSRRLNFAVVTLVAGAYAGLSLSLAPGVDFSVGEEKMLIIRIAMMFAVVAAANLMARIERTRRREAVEAERAQSVRNLELQKKAQEAELATLEERHRIAREIHDGVAQSIYALNLNLETCAHLAEQEDSPLKERLQRLVPMAKQTLLETRHYIYDLEPLLSGERDFVAVAENQVKEFGTVAGIPVNLSTEGEPREVTVAVGTGLYRILQEALANTLKHAHASGVDVALTFERDRVRLSVRDDGAGFRTEDVAIGYGMKNMRERAKELDGSFDVTSAPGEGTLITVTLPAREVGHGADQSDAGGRP